MNIRLVLNLAGFVLIFSSGFMLLPLMASRYYGGDDTYPITVSFALTLVSGLLLYFVNRGQRKVELKHRDGFAVVTISWLAMSLYGSFPYILSGAASSFTDAYFESMAGFTTTGASVLSNLEALPEGILLWRSLTQWMGGMGIIVLSIAILPMLGVGGMQLFKAEVPEIGVEKIRPRILDIAKSLWKIYVVLTLVLVLLLLLGGMNLFDALCHSFTTMATGGFSTKSASVTFFQSAYIDFIITLFMFLAGVNFSLHFYALRGDFSRFLRSSEFRFYCSIVLVATTAITLNLLLSGEYSSVAEAIRYASFQVVSLMTTTGYVTGDYEVWPFLSQMILLLLMFLGGMVGSTGGGMKQVRILLIFKQAYRELYHLIHPHALTALKLDGRSLPKETIGGIWGFLFLFILISAFSAICLTIVGVDLATAVTTVISSMSNVGPALGDAGPTDNYSSIPKAGKWILIMCMLIGRLEIYTVIVLFVPHFWRK
jgi:trk system potassium uptake protein TrkH